MAQGRGVKKGRGPFLGLVGLALLSTLLFRLAFPEPSLFPLAWVALAPLFWVAARETPLRAAASLAGAGLTMALLSLSGFRHLTWAAYLTPAFIGMGYYALVGAGLSWAVRRRGVPLILAAPILWTAYEYLRSVVPVIKFPWLLAGQTQVPWLQVIQAADLGGVYLLTFVMAVANAAVAQAALEWKMPFRRTKILLLGGLPVGLILACHIYGVIRIRTIRMEEGPTVALVQGNIPQEIKLTGQGRRMMEEYFTLSMRCLKDQPDLLVWPETMYPWPLMEEEWQGEPETSRRFYRGERDRLLGIARRGKTHLLIGALRKVGEEMRNSAYHISERGEFLGRYDKIDLVPLGESIPFAQGWPAFGRFLKENFLPKGFGSLKPGTELPIFEVQGSRFAVSICYEISFAGLAREARRKGAEFFVSISNDAWFKQGPEMDFAKDQAIFRAVENRVGIARAANTGISSFVDPVGRSHLLTRGGRRKEIEGTLVREIRTSTQMSLYCRWGDLFAWVILGGCALILLPFKRLRWLRKERPGSGGGEV